MRMNPHPAAAVWPMLPDDELAELAKSITEVGLLEPVVHWADPDTGELFLLDGRNRLAACLLAGVVPDVVVYEGDPVAYVLARNETRRHMTKGQRAMAAWMTASVLPQVTVRSVAEQAGVSSHPMGQAKVVHDHAPDLVELVLDGTRSLKAAYDEARERRVAASSEQAQLERLPTDLASQVREESLTLAEATAAHRAREAERRRDIEDADRAAAEIVTDFQAAAGTIMGGMEADGVARLGSADLEKLLSTLELMKERKVFK